MRSENRIHWWLFDICLVCNESPTLIVVNLSMTSQMFCEHCGIGTPFEKTLSKSTSWVMQRRHISLEFWCEIVNMILFLVCLHLSLEKTAQSVCQKTLTEPKLCGFTKPRSFPYVVISATLGIANKLREKCIYTYTFPLLFYFKLLEPWTPPTRPHVRDLSQEKAMSLNIREIIDIQVQLQLSVVDQKCIVFWI